MEQALYHPEHGYYTSGQKRTGRHGDFLTPVSSGPVLGELLAVQANELYRTLKKPVRMRLIEQGADAGWLARDLLEAIHRAYPELAKAVELFLIEPHPRWAEKQRNTLKEVGRKAHWYQSWDEIPGDDIPVFFYSCELIDSFPVRIFQYRAGAWRERWVGSEGSQFIWQDREVDAETQTQIRRWNPPEAEGFTMEIRPASPSWVKSWAAKITHGMVLSLDYGFPTVELFSPARASGTLVAIRHHQRVRDPLADPGQLDLTAHVNFTELEELGRDHGFTNYGLVDFARGLTTLAAPLLKTDQGLSESWIRNFRHLTHPSFFGHSHKILVQGKSLPVSFIPSILAGI